MRPLSLWVSLTRDPAHTLPMLLASFAAALGVAMVMMVALAIARTALAPTDFLLGTLYVEARAMSVADAEDRVRALDGTEDTFKVVTGTATGRFLDIQLPFPIHFMDARDIDRLLARYGDHIAAGRAPSGASFQALVPVPFARGRSLDVGDGLAVEGAGARVPVAITGLVDGPRWVGIGSLPASSAVRQNALIVFPRAGADIAALEDQIVDATGGLVTVRHWTVDPSGSESKDRYVADLALLLGFIVTVNAIVLSTITALLAVLYFRQRRRELVLLSVLGWSRGALGLRALGEIAVVILTGWAAGIAATWGVMHVVDALVISERGIAVPFYDPSPALLSLPLLATAVFVSAAVIAIGLVRFDPIAQLQGSAV